MDVHHVCLKQCLECRVAQAKEGPASRLCPLLHQTSGLPCCSNGKDLVVTILEGSAYYNLSQVRLFFNAGAFRWDTTERVDSVWVRMKNLYKMHPRSKGKRNDYDYVRIWSSQHVTRLLVGGGQQCLVRAGELVDVLQEMYEKKEDSSFILLKGIERYDVECGWKKTNKRKRVTAFQKRVVAHKNGWRCNDCGEALPAEYEVDHSVELRDGGSNRAENLQALCSNCHAFKTNFRFRLPRPQKSSSDGTLL